MQSTEQHDYNTPIEKTSTELAKSILTKLESKKDLMVIASYDKLTPEEKKAFETTATDFSIEIMGDIAKSDLPFMYATKPIDKVMMVLESLKQYINGTVTQYRHEFASRTLGVKSYDNKFREEDATIGMLLLKLQEVRDAQGNDPKDYFNITEQPDLSTEDTVVVEETKE